MPKIKDWRTRRTDKGSKKLPPEKLISILKGIYPEDIAEELYLQLTDPKKKEKEGVKDE